MLDSQNVLILFTCSSIILFSSCQEDDGLGEINAVNNTFELEDISGLPQEVIHPVQNSYSAEKEDLGRLLFWDPILSGNKDVACASCHHPDFAYADARELSSGVGGVGLGPNRVNGALVNRNSPSILNTAFNGVVQNGVQDPESSPMFWDSRASGLEEQAVLPMISAEEMRGEEISEEDIMDSIVSRLNAIDEYRDLFQSAYGTAEITELHIAQALSTFQRSLVANNSPFDAYMRGDENALSPAEINGMETFIEVGCVNCHNGPMFSDFELHTLSTPDHPLIEDDGATGDFDFRTPSLRNLAFTAPYMHNGVFEDIRDVLDFYNDISGGNGDSQNNNVNDNQIDEDARDLNINNRAINDIIRFLETLNDDDFDTSIPASLPSGLSVGGEIL